MRIGILKFQEVYMERIWGGNKLHEVLNRNIPSCALFGEAWLIADHPACESIVVEGPLQGKTLRELMLEDSESILGSRVQPTTDGRFPLLLKLIDAGDVLSVQVHPDDEQAAALHEPDGGKTEMWYVLDAEQESKLFVGLCPGVTRETMKASIEQGNAEKLVHSFPVKNGDSVFVASGVIHAIGAGILLAEIQQNSNITYRLYDWNRKDAQGNPRQLHVEKALEVINYDASPKSTDQPLRYEENGCSHEILAACSYFATEKLSVSKETVFESNNTFHIIHATGNEVCLLTEDNMCVLKRGEAALIPAKEVHWSIKAEETRASLFCTEYARGYYCAPLQRHGYNAEQINVLI